MSVNLGFVQKRVRELLKEISDETGLPLKTVHEIVVSQFDYVSSEMASGDINDGSTFKTVVLRYLGTFAFQKNKHAAIGYNIKKNEKYTGGVQSEE